MSMTNRQKQNLLQYLGYYEGRPDGIWGDLSRRATEAFQSDYLPPASVDGIFGPITETRILEVIASGEHPQTDAARNKCFHIHSFHLLPVFSYATSTWT